MEYDIILFGTGSMARAYAAVLKGLGASAVAIGRSEEHAAKFASDTGMSAEGGGFGRWRERGNPVPRNAIVAVAVQNLVAVATEAMEAGCRQILLEKPGGLSRDELMPLAAIAKKTTSQVRVAYNRRYLGSVIEAKRLMMKDGGPVSFSFIFTERAGQRDIVEKLGFDRKVIERWFIANTTHVVDLAFYLGGWPIRMISYVAVGPTWKPHPSLFAGSGITGSEVPFIYGANWELPGPWSIEIATANRKLILAPLETLREEKRGIIEELPYDRTLDTAYKPGLYRQVEEFLKGTSILPTLDEQIEHFSWYGQMLQAGMEREPFGKQEQRARQT